MRIRCRYDVLRTLGQGSAGSVFLVADRARRGERLALKHLGCSGDAVVRASFETEFAVASSLSLPGVARVFDFGVSDEPGRPLFFTREFVDGVPLSERARELEADGRVALFLEVARVVAALHHVGVVHGDLKPTNVLVRPDGTPCVIDFGLASFVGDRRVGTGGSGTLPFMAPEVLRGDRPSISSDVYALGATLWDVLLGRPPFGDLDERSLSSRARGETPVIPAAADVRTRRVLEATLRALSPEPAARFSAASELVAVLESFVADKPRSPRIFIAPRPRGHEGGLRAMEAWACATDDRGSDGRCALLVGPERSGRTTLLRELKWRLQIRGIPTLDVHVRDASALESLAAQLECLLSPDDASAGELASFASAPARAEGGARFEDLLARATTTVRAKTAFVMLVDDYDDAPEALRVAIRSMNATQGRFAFRSVVAVREPGREEAAELGAFERFVVPKLSPDEIDALVDEGLGPVERAISERIAALSDAKAGVVVDLIERLTHVQGPTEADVDDAFRPNERRGPPPRSLEEIEVRGHFAEAERVALEMFESPDTTETDRERAAASVVKARSALARTDEAVSFAEQVLASNASVRARALVSVELARALLLRGDYDRVVTIVTDALGLSPGDDIRVELLMSLGMVASYRADSRAALKHLEDARGAALRTGSKKQLANVLGYTGIVHQRAGRGMQAKQLYQASFALAEELGEVGLMALHAMNLGTICFDLAEPHAAKRQYERALELARRAGRATTALRARVNLAQLCVYLGLYERAGALVGRAFVEADALEQRLVAAQAMAIVATRHARLGDIEKSLVSFDEAATLFRELGQHREEADALLEAAETLLDRGGPADASAAAARLADARGLLAKEDAANESQQFLRLLLARWEGTAGGLEHASLSLETLAQETHELGHLELAWRAEAAFGDASERLGRAEIARSARLRAIDILRRIESGLSPDEATSFWLDPRRAKLRESVVRSDAAEAPADRHARRDDVALRLFEVTKRLLREHDVSRLLDRITDAAIDFARAERGFVILSSPSGELDPVSIRASSGVSEATLSFSRTIAESVIIDGTPVLTTDARADGRFREYLSIHKLNLRSVACLPIRGRDETTLGVLYLEHRALSGRFEDVDLDYLMAFADHAAIALENARLVEALREKQRELEEANGRLGLAKVEVEIALSERDEELVEMRRQVVAERSSASERFARDGMLGRSAPMRRVYDLIERIAAVSVPVVVRGESGTGKELAARAIHARSTRAAEPFVAVNCGAVSESLLESELFGHVRGAFTGAERARRGLFSQAHGGTLFLDEIADMSPKMQIELLRVLADGKIRPVGSDVDERVDVRIVAATRYPLVDLVHQGSFREDLFYRLHVVEVVLPPLRERSEDIPLLAEHILSDLGRREGRGAKRLSRTALAALVAAPWAGNIRELQHVLTNAYILTDGPVIDASALSVLPSVAAPSDTASLPATTELPRPISVAPASFDEHKDQERERMLSALAETGWNRARAATLLGMARRTFYRRLHEHGLLEPGET